jgi:hypothetical protein
MPHMPRIPPPLCNVRKLSLAPSRYRPDSSTIRDPRADRPLQVSRGPDSQRSPVQHTRSLLGHSGRFIFYVPCRRPALGPQQGKRRLEAAVFHFVSILAFAFSFLPLPAGGRSLLCNHPPRAQGALDERYPGHWMRWHGGTRARDMLALRRRPGNPISMGGFSRSRTLCQGAGPRRSLGSCEILSRAFVAGTCALGAVLCCNICRALLAPGALSHLELLRGFSLALSSLLLASGS